MEMGKIPSIPSPGFRIKTERRGSGEVMKSEEEPSPKSNSIQREEPLDSECSIEDYHPQVTAKLHCEKLKYALLSEERGPLKTRSWFSCIPRGLRSKPKVPNKLIVMVDHVAGVSAGAIPDKYSCPGSSTSRSCTRLKGKRKSRQKDEGSGSEVIVPARIHIRGRVTRFWNKSNTTADERGKLDSATFLRYFMHIWDAFPEDKVKSVAYFDPLWLDLYANGNNPAAVLKWIKEKGIFSKKYVLVPIVIWSHWSLLIFCHLGESLLSKTSTPCMLLLDSLHAIGPTRLEPLTRRLLFDIHQTEDRLEGSKELKKMRLLIPKVPQQKKGDECGFYVLYYIKLFLESAPENFNISAGYPYFMKKDWFTAEDMEAFCQKLDVLPVEVSENDDDRMSQSSDTVEFIGTFVS